MELNLIALQGAPGTELFLFVALIVIFYFFMIRPQQKRQKEIKKFREGLNKGDRIITAGGIHGRIQQIKDNDNAFLVEIADGVRILVDKNSVYPLGTDTTKVQETSEELKK